MRVIEGCSGSNADDGGPKVEPLVHTSSAVFSSGPGFMPGFPDIPSGVPGTKDLRYTPTIKAEEDRWMLLMSVSAMPAASHSSVEELRWEHRQEREAEPVKREFSIGFGRAASGSNSNNEAPLHGAPSPLPTSRRISIIRRQSGSQEPNFTPSAPVQAPEGFSPFSTQTMPFTTFSKGGLSVDSFGFPDTIPGNTSSFGVPSTFGSATPTDCFPGFPTAPTCQPAPPSPFTKPGNTSSFGVPSTFGSATPTDCFPGFPTAPTCQPAPPSPFTKPGNTSSFGVPSTFGSATPTHCFPGVPIAPTCQPAPPSPFTIRPTTERDAGKPLLSTGESSTIGNSPRCKECGRKAPEGKHGPSDNHVPVPATMPAPSQIQQGDHRVCSRSTATGEDALRVEDGSRMAPSGLLPAIPVMMLPVMPTFNGAFGAVPGSTGPGYFPGSYMFPGTTIPPFVVPHNLLGTQTTSGVNATPFAYMQPVPFAAVNGLAQMFGRMHM